MADVYHLSGDFFCVDVLANEGFFYFFVELDELVFSIDLVVYVGVKIRACVKILRQVFRDQSEIDVFLFQYLIILDEMGRDVYLVGH